jgi:Na/Pi-cotransporter
MKTKIKATILLFATMLMVSCNQENDKKLAVNKLKVIAGADQTIEINKPSKEIQIEFLSKPEKGILGGKGEPKPVCNELANLILPKGLTLSSDQTLLKSNAGGISRFTVKAQKPGDYYIKIVSSTNHAKSLKIRLSAGVTTLGAKQELKSGEESDVFGVRITDKEGKAINGVKVYYTITSRPGKKNKAKLTKSVVLTDENGEAFTTLKSDDSETGIYNISAEIPENDKTVSYRTIIIKQLAANRPNIMIAVLAGLALFIFGMTQMSNGLQQVAGNRLKTILGYFTRNRIIAVITGATVTGFIQSSSACTVMVVGFVNAGLLNLQQAIGVVFGSNIGTTITAQMLSLKLDGLAFPAIIIGVLVLMIAKRSAIKGWASVVLGFGLLFYGMGMMSGQLKALSHYPTFINFFKSFDCTPLHAHGYMPIGAVIGAIVIGTLMTVIIQSSSATTGITLALAAGGLINFYTAIPLILGSNIGTTITAILAAIGSNRTAKQTALAHTMFNLIGAIGMIFLLYVKIGEYPIFMAMIDHMTDGNVFAAHPENITRHIAMAHTMFNVLAVLIMLPFIGLFVKICQTIIPIAEGDQDHRVRLEPHLLNTPSLALQQATSQIRSMTKRAWKMMESSVEIINTGDFSKAEKIHEQDDEIDEMQKEVNDYLSKLAKMTLTTSQSLAIPMLVHCNNNAERMGDNAEEMVNLARRIDKDHMLTPDMVNQINAIVEKLKAKVSYIKASFEADNSIDLKEMLKQDLQFKKDLQELENSDLADITAGKEDVIVGVTFLEIISILGKTNSRLSNIWERAMTLTESGIITNPIAKR